MHTTFRQLFDAESGTYTYLIWDAASRKAALIDPVRERLSRDMQLLKELGLQLQYVLETHVHADHVTAAPLLREKTGARIGVSRKGGAQGADFEFVDGEKVALGEDSIRILETPGHTQGCLTYLWRDCAFTGDALLIRKCGRTDFQQGDSMKLFQSVRERLFALPDDTWVFPGHEYEGRSCSTIGEEKQFNARLNLKITAAGFVEIMKNLSLPAPKKIKESVPANLQLGRTDNSRTDNSVEAK